MSCVVSVSLSGKHTFSKQGVDRIALLTGLGVEGDAHCGALVKHRYHLRKDPTRPNLCQVHLIHSELFEELASKGIVIAAGDMGENITTSGLDLLGLPTGAHLKIGNDAVVEVTGLRNPCVQMNDLRPGLMQAVIERVPGSKPRMKAGIMGIVVAGGVVRPSDTIHVELPPQPWRPMACV
ncbi:MOSC domain-containing protein YiiM [Granulicella aggregans]|uniref:MOSC domain-containing protein YiiM n=1 Tax=Granulicella aggregans TaxID=474949 RepID=A0A7W7Z9U8_9BACT|nr:MOSC domain-containing protein [Granulicella aggregans]MBB5055724.1 MOSC domain-containing protein YiiM [Granulicella aggregans]